jgi:hypothetical protein
VVAIPLAIRSLDDGPNLTCENSLAISVPDDDRYRTDLAVEDPRSLARALKVKPTSTPKGPLATGAKLIDPAACAVRRDGVQPARRPVLREEPPMPVKCVTCGLLFRTSNDLD